MLQHSFWHLHCCHCQPALTRRRCWSRRRTLRTRCSSGRGSPWSSASSPWLWSGRSDPDSPAPPRRYGPARRRTRLWRTSRRRWSQPRRFSSTRAWSWLLGFGRTDRPWLLYNNPERVRFVSLSSAPVHRHPRQPHPGDCQHPVGGRREEIVKRDEGGGNNLKITSCCWVRGWTPPSTTVKLHSVTQQCNTTV